MNLLPPRRFPVRLLPRLAARPNRPGDRSDESRIRALPPLQQDAQTARQDARHARDAGPASRREGTKS